MNNNRFRQARLILFSFVVLLGFSGCISDPTRVSKTEFRKTIECGNRIKIGLSKEEFLALFPYGRKELISTTPVQPGVVVEEWTVRAAYISDFSFNWFNRYFYFLNGRLVDYNEHPLAYRERDDLIGKWLRRN